MRQVKGIKILLRKKKTKKRKNACDMYQNSSEEDKGKRHQYYREQKYF